MKIYLLVGKCPLAPILVGNLAKTGLVEGVFVERGYIRGGNAISIFFNIVRRSGWRFAFAETIAVLTAWIFHRLKKFFRINKLPLVSDFSGVSYIKDVHGEKFLGKFRGLHPDLLVMARYNKIVSQKLMNIPRLGTINCHTGVLPAYRGLSSTFHSLRNHSSVIGATIHKAIPKIDGGVIYRRGERSVEAGESLLAHELATYQCAGEVLMGCLKDVARDNAGIQRFDIYDSLSEAGQSGSYFTWPTKQEVADFLKSGRKLWRFRDFLTLWRLL
ncbi:MAG: methionyl-tRNA formyltransferase [Parcubacteria group bacterium Gr01-1014_19]|nr:MAG: methionyl-tRNA formyltransferase [Parcubacteria group bacterium Gr01-1014_19]